MFSPSPNAFRKPKINNTERLSASWQEGQGEFTGPVQPLPARLSSCADDAYDLHRAVRHLFSFTDLHSP